MTAARTFTYTLHGEPIDLETWAKQVVDPLPPLTETQRARIRALLVHDEEPSNGGRP